MARHSYMTDLEAVQTWFSGVGNPLWNLYRGHLDKMHGSKLIYRQTDDTVDLAESWSTLRSMIESNSANGGQFTIYVPTNANGNQGVSIHVGLNMEQYQGTQNRNTGIAGPGYALGMIPAAQLEKELSTQRYIWDLERRLEDVEAGQEAGLGITDILKDQLRQIDLSPLIAGLGQFLAAKSVPGGVQLQGHPADFQAPEETESEPAYDGSRLVPALNMIRPHFETDDEFYNFLDKVAQMFVANPAMFKNMAL